MLGTELLVFLIITINLLFSAITLAETPPVILEDNKGFYEIGLNLDILEDPSGKLTIEDVNSPEWAGKFKRSKDKVPNYGFSKSAFWARINIKNLAKNQKTWIISQNYVLQDRITLYKKIDGHWNPLTTGDATPFKTREIKDKSFSFEIKPSKTSVYFFRIIGAANRFNLTISSPKNFTQNRTKDNLISGLFFGLVIAMVLYNLFIFISTKSLSYLYYVLYVLFYGITFFILQGFSLRFLAPNSIWVANNGVSFFGGLTALFMTLFSISFLRLDEQNPRLYKVSLFFCITNILVILASLFLPYSVTIKSIALTVLSTTPFVLFCGIYRVKENYRPAKYFLLAIFFAIFGGIILVLMSMGILPPSDLVKQAPYIGNAMELILLSMGLGDRFNLIQEDALKVSKENILLQESYTKDLEAKVLERTNEIDKKNTELIKSNEARTRFFQNISHELRTPLTLIMNPIEHLRAKYSEDKDIEIADKNSKRLYRLVNQLLDLQKLSSSSKKINLSSVNLGELCYKCAEIFGLSCQSRKMSFYLSINKAIIENESDIPNLYIEGEIDSLEKVIFNYLTNALKHTPKGGSITLDLEDVNNKVILKVIDNGDGISKDNIRKLFKIFSQVDDSTTRGYEGTGIGLSLTKELVERMNGSVGVESELGKGSTFIAIFNKSTKQKSAESLKSHKVKEWPMADSGSSDLEVNNTLINEDTNPRVLIIDDVKDMRDIIARDLSPHYSTVMASHGEMGLEFVKKYKPSLVIVDWMMPIMSGPDFISKIKSDRELSSIPVVLLTAKSDEESKFKGHKIGADSFLGKPFNQQELLSIVSNLINLKSTEKELEKKNQEITDSVLKRYLSPDLVDDIIKGDLKINETPKKIIATVLFVDICGFTKISNNIKATTSSLLLNEYFKMVCDIVFDNNGTIDKFMGDGVMVFFGAPIDMPLETQAKRAIHCARDIHQGMAQLSNKWNQSFNISNVKVRIGINQGEILVGNFGSDKRVDYTAIGPTVNLASRIEKLARPGQTLVGGNVRDFLKSDHIAASKKYDIKGLSDNITLYEISKESLSTT